MAMRAFITGCSGLTFTPDERAFLRASEPWGLILFRRNVDSPAQLHALTQELRQILGYDAAVLIDQEGGRVQRLSAPHWRAYPAGATFASTAPERAAELAHLAARLMAHDLRAIGINVNCLPVLDAPIKGAHDVIGNRAYSHDPEEAARIGRAAAEGSLAGGVLPVMKHIPGHGRAMADSHLALPIVDCAREELEERDFKPFRLNRDLPAAMTAHVVYSAIDPYQPATQSPIVVSEIIRGLIGFDGLLMSDDLSMQALQGSFQSRTEKLFAAGVDLALHCNGDLTEADAVANHSPQLEGRALARAEAARDRARADHQSFDPVEGWRELQAGLAVIA